MSELPGGPRFAIDWGRARIGVAQAPLGSSLAFPVATIPAGEKELTELLQLLADYQPTIAYVGFPITLSGQQSLAAEFTLSKARELAEKWATGQVRLLDERLSTATASRSMSRAGRSQKRQRTVIDQAAAVEILQRALDFEHQTGKLAGQPAELEDL